MANERLNRAFDVMAIALAEAGSDPQTIVKFVQYARQFFGVPHEESAKTRTKADIAVLATELKERDDDSSMDRGSEATQSGKTGRARAGSAPS